VKLPGFGAAWQLDAPDANRAEATVGVIWFSQCCSVTRFVSKLVPLELLPWMQTFIAASAVGAVG